MIHNLGVENTYRMYLPSNLDIQRHTRTDACKKNGWGANNDQILEEVWIVTTNHLHHQKAKHENLSKGIPLTCSKLGGGAAVY